MKTFESPIFGLSPQPESFEELMSLIFAPRGSDGGAVRMWRGQSDIEWPLHSSAYRKLALDGKRVDDGAVLRYEQRLLDHATHRGYRQVDGRELKDFELLARLQHHGAATRLVDFTRSALVGIYFCVAASEDKVGALFGIHTDVLGGIEGTMETRPYDDVVKDLQKRDYPMTWEPTVVSPRVAAQHSQFLYSRLSHHKSGSLLLPEKDGATLVVAVNPELKKVMRRLLVEAFDIRDVTLFPDLDGFCAANSPRVGQWDYYRW